MPPTRSYLICATPRSGSTLLCEALESTGIAGNPKEYFEALKTTGLPRRPKEYFTTLENQEIMNLLGDFSRDHASTAPPSQAYASYAEYLAHVLEEGMTPNGIFGAKVMWGYFDDFISNLRDIPAFKKTPVPELLSSIFPDLCYIRVSRLDKVRQAISLWKAIQTYTWREDEPASFGDQQVDGIHEPQKQVLHFHFPAIDYLIQQIEEHERAWQRYFDEIAIRPFNVVYEDLSANYEGTALRILEYLNIPIPAQPVFAARRMKRQSNALSEEWVERYHMIKQGQMDAVS